MDSNIICTDIPTDGSLCEFSAQSAICNREWQNITLTNCSGTHQNNTLCSADDDNTFIRILGGNGHRILLLVIIPSLTLLLLSLAVLVLLSRHFFKKKSQTGLW